MTLLLQFVQIIKSAGECLLNQDCIKPQLASYVLKDSKSKFIPMIWLLGLMVMIKYCGLIYNTLCFPDVENSPLAYALQC